MKCPDSGLILPKKFIDEKQSLKKIINDWVDKVVNQYQHLKGRYFITFHAKFNKFNPGVFEVDSPKITSQLPPFISNTLVYYVCNKRSICELLWMIPAKKKGEKLQPVFNTKGVAYLQAKGAMPS